MPDPNPIIVPNLTGPWVDVRSFADPNTARDGKKDWWPMIQGAVDYLLKQPITGDVGTLYLPPGIYRISRPIQISSSYFAADIQADVYTFCSIQIAGDSPGLGANAFHGSVIQADFTDVPAIIIEGARIVTIRNLVIMGKNTWIEQPGRDPRDAAIHYDDANYLCNAVRDAPQSPYAGIHIDPFDNRYPGAVLPPDGGYPGLSSRYLRGAGSVQVQIEGCHIYGFVVGVAISLNGSAFMGNAEGISLVDCTIGSTKSAIAVGQTQSRGLTVQNLYAEAAKYVIDCTNYGRGSGDCPSIFGAVIGGTKYIFSTFSSGSTPSINGLYSEAVMSIGQLGGAGAQDGHVFNACTFAFLATPAGKPALFRLRSLTSTIFNGCNFGMSDDGIEPMWFAVQGPTSFNNCNWARIVPGDYPSFYANGGNGWSERTTFNDSFMVATHGDPAVTSQLAGVPLSKVQALDLFTTYYNTFLAPGCLFYELGAAANSLRWVAGGFRKISLSAGTIKLTVGTSGVQDGTATFTAPDPTIVRTGDFIFSDTIYHPYEGPYATGIIPLVIGRVRDVNASTGVVSLINVPEAVLAGTTTPHLSIAHWPRAHLPSQGAITASSTSVTVQNNLGSYWEVGNRILAEGGYIVDGTYITARNGNTLTLSKATKNNVPAGGAIVRIYDADVREIATTKL